MTFINFLLRVLAFHVLLIPVITLLGASVLLVLARLKKSPAALRAAISGATLIVVLLLPWAAMTVPKITIPIFSTTSDAQTESLDRHLSPPGVILPPFDLSEVPAASSEPALSAEPSNSGPAIKSSSHELNWRVGAAALMMILISVWIIGVLWGLGTVMAGVVGIAHLRWSSPRIAENRLIKALQASCARLNCRGSVLFLISDQIALPITWGWFQAKIALPYGALNWSAEQIDAALLHELAHITRRDFAIQTLSRVTCALHWYNPLVIELFRVWKSEAEQACDDLVLRSGYSGERYSDILLEVWRSATAPRPQNSLGLAMVRTSTLEQRVIAILDPEKVREEISSGRRMQLLAIFGGITLLIASISLVRPSDHHLTPDLRNDAEAILQQAQFVQNTRLVLQMSLNRQLDDWSMTTRQFEQKSHATVAEIRLELDGETARYQARYHPWFSESSDPIGGGDRTDTSDGNQTWTDFSDGRKNSKWSGNLDISETAGFAYRPNWDVEMAAEGLLENGVLPFNSSTYGIQETTLNGVTTIRLQEITNAHAITQRRTWWLDPRRDYSLVQYEIASFENGSSLPSGLELVTVDEWQKVADRIWYPTRFTTQGFHYQNGQIAAPTFRSTTTISSLTAVAATAPVSSPAANKVVAASQTKQNSQPQGRVLDTTGDPVANAEITLVPTGRLITITDGEIDPKAKSVLSTYGGGFNLNSPSEAGDLLVVTHEDGYAAILWDKFSGTVTLRPWAKVSGTAFSGTTPASGKTVEVLMFIPPNPRSWNEGQVRFRSSATVDPRGSFVTGHVPEGVVEAMLSASPTLDQSSLIETVHLETKAGQTTQTDFGGQGITVTGKAVMPNDPDLDLNWGQPFWARSPVGLNIPSGMPQEQVDKLTRDYYASEAGKKALLAARTHYFHLQQDGSFKIENISPGSYELRIDFIHKRSQGGRTWSVGNTSSRVEVKAGDASVEVPLLKLHLLSKPPVAGDQSMTSMSGKDDVGGVSALWLEGNKMTPEQIAALETKVAKDPSDLPDRIRILGYYVIKRSLQPAARDAAQPHILWIIRNVPSSTAAGDPVAGVNYRLDLPHYEEARQAWTEALAKYPNDPKVVGNAASFFLLNDPGRAEKLLLRGQKLEPNNSDWATRLGQFYQLQSISAPPASKAAVNAEALQAYEKGMSSLKGIDLFHALEAPTKAAFAAGDYVKAHQYAEEFLQMAPQYSKDWNYGNAVYTSNVVLGQIALAKGDVPLAETYLQAAGDSRGSPTLDSFGPDLTLARQLLGKGEKDAVITFLGKISTFWAGHQEQILGWQKSIQQGQTTF